MNTENKNTKNYIIIILIILLLLSITYIIATKFNVAGIDKKASFIKDVTKMQNEISYYVGTTYSDTFGAYDKTQIATGKVDGKEIKDINNTNLIPIANIDEKIEKDNTISYRLNSENIKQVLKLDLPKYEGINWYIQDGTLIRFEIEQKPVWWTSDLDSLLIGKK